jgi:hypothetical protein
MRKLNVKTLGLKSLETSVSPEEVTESSLGNREVNLQKMKKLLLAFTALASLTIASHGQIPLWTREQLIKFYGFRGVNVEYEESHISSISFVKQDPHIFHGGECFSLVIGVLRGPEGKEIIGGDPAIRVDDDGVWHDSITGCVIDSGRDSFHFTAKRSGVVVLTASLIPGKYSSEFKLVSVSDAGPGSLNQNPDAMINDTTEDDDLNRAWAALSQRQRNRLRQAEREWIKQREALPKDEQNEFTKERTSYLRSLGDKN